MTSLVKYLLAVALDNPVDSQKLSSTLPFSFLEAPRYAWRNRFVTSTRAPIETTPSFIPTTYFSAQNT